MKSLSSNMDKMDDQGEVVDAEAVDIDDKE